MVWVQVQNVSVNAEFIGEREVGIEELGLEYPDQCMGGRGFFEIKMGLSSESVIVLKEFSKG